MGDNSNKNLTTTLCYFWLYFKYANEQEDGTEHFADVKICKGRTHVYTQDQFQKHMNMQTIFVDFFKPLARL